MVYNIPDIHSNAAGAILLKGWTWSNIVTEQTGFPYACQESFGMNTSNSEMGVEDIGGNLQNDRCDFVTASNLAYAQSLNPAAVVYNKNTVIQHKASQWFNPNMFTTPVPGLIGNTPRGLMRGAPENDWDFSLVKNTHIAWLGEKTNFEFRTEIFNILNHTNLAFPYQANFNANYDALVSAGTGVNGTNINPVAGQVTNTLINARQIQFAGRLEF
jgi:hypothetical protein